MSDLLKIPKTNLKNIQKQMEKVGKSCGDALKNLGKNDESFFKLAVIADDIRDRKDNAMAMEFTRVICEHLKPWGVKPKITEITTGGIFDNGRNIIEEHYGCIIEGLDFTEHDKVFEDKIAELKKIVDEYRKAESETFGENQLLKRRIAELEAELEGKERPLTTEICTSTPLDCANSLIHHLTHLDAFLIAPERDVQTFTVDDLEQIAEHLLIYCKHNRESK